MPRLQPCSGLFPAKTRKLLTKLFDNIKKPGSSSAFLLYIPDIFAEIILNTCTTHKNVLPLHPQDQGEMAEWSIAAVLKTVEGNTSGGSNPSLSAHKTNQTC